MYQLQEGSPVDVSVIKTVGDLIVAAKEGIDVGSNNRKESMRRFNQSYSYSSAAAAASKLIAVFPVLVSRTVSTETAMMVSKYIEQKACIILQLALQQANIADAQTGIDYLKKFHNNLNIGGNGVDAMGDMIDTMVKIAQSTTDESAISLSQKMMIDEVYEDFDDSYIYESDDSIKISATQMNDLMKMFAEAEACQIYDTKLNPRSISDYMVNESSGDYHVSIKALQEGIGYGIPNNVNKDGYKIINTKNVTFLKDQDIKKMNSAVPSILIVKFWRANDAKVATEFIVGVKSTVLGVNSDEILRRVANDNKDGKWFLNLMRTLTGELKKTDFLFGLSRTYEDLASTKKKGAMGDTWELLKTRAAAAKAAVKAGTNNNYSAITTVVVSQDDCDSLYREENIDLNNPSIAKHFMQSYNLLGVILVDDSTESLKVMFDDGNNYFEELSYRTLERDTDGGTYKKLINLISQSR